jgi:hypothetical protein
MVSPCSQARPTVFLVIRFVWPSQPVVSLQPHADAAGRKPALTPERGRLAGPSVFANV